MAVMSLFLVLIAILIGLNLWYGWRLVRTQTIHRTAMQGRGYIKSIEYRGADRGKYVKRYGQGHIAITMLSIIGWVLLLIDGLGDNNPQLGTLGAIGIVWMIGTVIMLIVYSDLMGRKLRMQRLR